MSSRHDISKPHRCVAAKCKGTMVDPPEAYGYWAYWWGGNDSGWHATPKMKGAKK